MVRDNVAVIAELLLAENTNAILLRDLPVHQFPHLGVRPNLAIASRMLGIVNAPDSNLARSSLLGDGFPSAARKRTVNRAQLISSESHSVLQQGLGF